MSWGFFVLKGMPINQSICGYSFQNEQGFQRDGDSFGPGFPIGARAPCWLRIPKGTAFPWREASNGGQSLPGGKNPKKPGFRGTRLCRRGPHAACCMGWALSLVCYTFGDRGWRKGVVRGGNKHFPSATEQADFGAPRAEIQDLPRGKIRLFGCRWCGEMGRRSAGSPRNGAASPGEPEVYQARRSDATLSRYSSNEITVSFGSFSFRQFRR